MIARVWSATATREHAANYARHFRSEVLPELKRLDGYAGATVLSRETSTTVEIVVMTWWRSLEAIRRFAGADPERAVVTDTARTLLAGYDERVRHYGLMVIDDLTIDD